MHAWRATGCIHLDAIMQTRHLAPRRRTTVKVHLLLAVLLNCALSPDDSPLASIRTSWVPGDNGRPT
jgi:hypothetical protein